MPRALEDLRQIISNSDIPLEDQNDLLVFLPILPETTLEDLKMILEKDPEWLKEFNAHFKAKLKALTGQKEEEWEEVIKKEAEESGDFSPDDLEENKYFEET